MQGSYLEAEARGIDLDSKTVTCTYTKPFVGAHFNEKSFELPYDVLVVAVRPLPETQSVVCISSQISECVASTPILYSCSYEQGTFVSWP